MLVRAKRGSDQAQQRRSACEIAERAVSCRVVFLCGLPPGRWVEAGAGMARIAPGAEDRDRVVRLSTDLLEPIATHADGESTRCAGIPISRPTRSPSPVYGRAAAGEGDAAVHDVAGELRRRAREGAPWSPRLSGRAAARARSRCPAW